MELHPKEIVLWISFSALIIILIWERIGAVWLSTPPTNYNQLIKGLLMLVAVLLDMSNRKKS